MSSELEQFTSYITRQFDKLENKIDALQGYLAENFISKGEMEHHKEDINRAHAKIRDLTNFVTDKIDKLESKLHGIEITNAGHQGRFTNLEKIGGVFVAIMVAAAMAYFKLN